MTVVDFSQEQTWTQKCSHNPPCSLIDEHDRSLCNLSNQHIINIARSAQGLRQYENISRVFDIIQDRGLAVSDQIFPTRQTSEIIHSVKALSFDSEGNLYSIRGTHWPTKKMTALCTYADRRRGAEQAYEHLSQPDLYLESHLEYTGCGLYSFQEYDLADHWSAMSFGYMRRPRHFSAPTGHEQFPCIAELVLWGIVIDVDFSEPNPFTKMGDFSRGYISSHATIERLTLHSTIPPEYRSQFAQKISQKYDFPVMEDQKWRGSFEGARLGQ